MQEYLQGDTCKKEVELQLHSCGCHFEFFDLLFALTPINTNKEREEIS